MRVRSSIAFGLFIIACHTAPNENAPALSEEKTAPVVPSKTESVHRERETSTPATAVGGPVTQTSERDAHARLAGIRPLKVGDIVAVTLLSPRSLSMKLRLKGGEMRVFKPLLTTDRRARYEVAAFRIAEYLGIEGVPSATVGELPIGFLANRLSMEAKESADALVERAALTDKQKVRGAEISWITDLDPDGLKKVGGVTVLKRWMSPPRPIEALEPILSSQVSRMFCFDYVIGNWDRFSGGNLFINKAADRLVLIDHNGTFGPWGEARAERMARQLKTVERFSASLIAKLRGMNEKEIGDALNKEPTHSAVPLLTNEEISLMLTRRDEVLAHVDALTTQYGASRVVVFD